MEGTTIGSEKMNQNDCVVWLWNIYIANTVSSELHAKYEI